MLVGLAKQRINELRESVVRVRSERDSYDQRIQELEKILSTFKEEYNPNFNDEGVKRAVRAWEDYAARDKTSHNAAADRDVEEMVKSDEHNGINWDEYEQEEGEGDTDVRKYKCGQSMSQSTSLTNSQSTNSKTTFRPASEPGSTRNCATCV